MADIVSPDRRYSGSYMEALREGLYLEREKDEEQLRLIGMGFDAYLQQRYDLKRPVIMPDGTAVQKVPQTDYWLVEGERFIGAVSVRHVLNDYLLKYGGHIGYAVRKNERRKGYGALQLKLVLPRVKKELGLSRVLITCWDNNSSSIRIIEAAGGALENRLEEAGSAVLKRRYWVEIK
jgi:predicted acetyltransferase